MNKRELSEEENERGGGNTSEEESSLPHCKYGEACYRKNPDHNQQFFHPHKDRNGNPRKIRPNKKMQPLPLPFKDVQFDTYDNGNEPITLIELSMNAMSAEIRSKPNWWEKRKDKKILEKWRKEASEKLGSEAIDFVFDELEWYEKCMDGSIQRSAVDGVWQSDELIPEDLRKKLLEGVAVLENVPDHEKDWHPGSNKQVLDLVHPSLYPLVYGRSRVVKEQITPTLASLGKGDQIDPPKKNNDYSESAKYQWLPSEISVNDEGKVKIDSYINNLHPVDHKNMYGTLGSIFEKFVPLFEKVLTDLVNHRDLRINPDAYSWWVDKDGEGQSEDEDEDDDEERREFVPPAVPKFKEPPSPKNEYKLRDRKLQVIIKLANIVLTPENPSYPGGSWHVEGMKNESIAASGIYYYDNENIGESNLSFRQMVKSPDYEQGDDEGIIRVYSLENEGELNQVLGSVQTTQNRCISFPNVHQHCVSPFKLADPSKPGHRKILVFFLVDPAVKILSTAKVPPQQRSWLAREMEKQDVFQNVAKDSFNQIVQELDWPMTHEEALKYREELMNERKQFVVKNNEVVFARSFSLCEH